MSGANPIATRDGLKEFKVQTGLYDAAFGRGYVPMRQVMHDG